MKEAYVITHLSHQAVPVAPSRARSCRDFRIWLVAWTSLIFLSSFVRTVAAEARLTWMQTPGRVDISWISESLTPTPPFVHYEFQLQLSSDLDGWETEGGLLPGGFLTTDSIAHSLSLATTNAHRFVRLSYRLNMPGADLSDLDLSGADLTGADLTGANLAGANLSGTTLHGALLAGADLTGANLAGATFAGADMDDVNLDGIDLTGVDLGTIQGTPVITQITADPATIAAEIVPDLPYNPHGSGLVADDVLVPGIVSTRDAMVMLRTNATVGQLNTLLATHGATIVASSPADATLPNAVLMARFPTASAQELLDITVALDSDPIVETAAPDVVIGLDIVPNDTTSAPGWRWDGAGIALGGNWGLESARVPQMWNVLPVLQQNGASLVGTSIIDSYFANGHPDLFFSWLLGPTSDVHYHGMHVAGIIGARYDNNVGVDGINPLALMAAYTLQTLPSDYPRSASLLDLFEPSRQANAYRIVQDIREVLRQAPWTRILNMSQGYNWHRATNAARPNITDPFTAAQLSSMEIMARKYGVLMAGVANAAPSALIVCSAGNSSNLAPARFNSPMATAALELGVPNIIVVGAHDITGAHASFSNLGGHVAAPGVDILSTGVPGGILYTNQSGTSMAAPFVSGVAGFLVAVDPTLDPPTRAQVAPSAVPQSGSHARSREEVLGPDFDDLTHVAGDGVINMADFRRWRDWLLFGLGGHRLNGSSGHLNFDANGDVTVNRLRELNYHPRADFNGDGKMDEHSTRLVPGWSQPLTDLEVLVFGAQQGLWQDPDYEDPFVLFDLIDSVDFNISATNFYYKHTDINADAKVSAHEVDTDAPLEDGAFITLSPDVTQGILTVPTGRNYFVASDPIPIGDGTNVVLRSIGERDVLESERGADFAVDLALWEMTAVANMLNPETNVVDSRALANRWTLISLRWAAPPAAAQVRQSHR
jgi:subtilisin family serine protease